MNPLSLTTYKAKKKMISSSVSDLLRSNRMPRNELEIERLVVDDMRKKIIGDEMNEINFYQIQQIENKKGPNNYRSIHLFSDIATVRGTKFHKKIKRSTLEKKLREKIAEEPGNLLFL